VEPLARATALTLELETLAPTVELDSRPSGATVEIDGKPLGGTPLTLTTLAAGATVTIVFKRRGYRDATAQLRVPGSGEVAQLVQPLEVSDDFVRVRFVSKPPGAQIIELGEHAATAEGRTYTPAEMFVEADQVQRFMLTMPDHVPVVIAPFTLARGVQGVEKGGDLVEGVTLRVEAWSAGKVTIAGAPHCQAVAVPAECTLAPGTYGVDYVGADAAKAKHTVTLAGRAAVVRFELGAGGPTATVQEVAAVPALPE
jgi:hypothetical protein